jgi:hypothetical protein
MTGVCLKKAADTANLQPNLKPTKEPKTTERNPSNIPDLARFFFRLGKHQGVFIR